jgi:hypothetical protein
MVLGVGLTGAIFTTMLARVPGVQSLFIAVQTSFLVGSIIAAIGILTSAIRRIGFERKEEEKLES